MVAYMEVVVMVVAVVWVAAVAVEEAVEEGKVVEVGNQKLRHKDLGTLSQSKVVVVV